MAFSGRWCHIPLLSIGGGLAATFVAAAGVRSPNSNFFWQIDPANIFSGSLDGSRTVTVSQSRTRWRQVWDSVRARLKKRRLPKKEPAFKNDVVRESSDVNCVNDTVKVSFDVSYV